MDQLKIEVEARSKSSHMVGISLRWMLGTLPDNPRVILIAQV